MSKNDIHVTSDEDFNGFGSMSTRVIVKSSNGFFIGGGAGHQRGESFSSKRIYWVDGIPSISESLIIHEDSEEYLKLKEMIKIPKNEDEFFQEYCKDSDGSIQKYCEEICYQQMIKKYGLHLFICQMRLLAYQRGLKEGIEQNRKAFKDALGL